MNKAGLSNYKRRRSSIYQNQHIIEDLVTQALEMEMLIWEPPADMRVIVKWAD